MEPRNEKNNIRTFALASFLNDMGSDMIYPIWPMFVTSYLNASTSLLGFIDGLGEAIVSLSQALSGYLSDRLQKRKIFIWLGYLFGSLSRVGYAFSASAHHLIPFRILDRAGKIRGAPRDALIADISTRQNRGKHFGILRTMDNLGAVCGILLCILLYKTRGFRNIMLLAALPSAAGAVLIFLFIREPARIDRPIFKGISFRAFETPLKRFFVLNSVFFPRHVQLFLSSALRRRSRIQDHIYTSSLPDIHTYCFPRFLSFRQMVRHDRTKESAPAFLSVLGADLYPASRPGPVFHPARLCSLWSAQRCHGTCSENPGFRNVP